MSAIYDLSWEKFSQHLCLMLKDIHEIEKYSDVTLISGNETQFKAHKIVLSACSPVFKKIIDNNPSQHPLIYLRGIQSYELESILQFMYLGESKVFQNRIREFIKVAKDLELKDVSDGEIVTGKIKENNAVPVSETRTWEELGEQKLNWNQSDCDYTSQNTLLTPTQSKHEEVKYPCNQPKYQTSTEGLQTHEDNEDMLQRKEDTVDEIDSNADMFDKYEVKEENKSDRKCPECGAIYSNKKNMMRHQKSTHGGVKYPCQECDYQFTDKSGLRAHTKSIHEGITYPCDYCDYLAPRKNYLQKHIKNIHDVERKRKLL